MKTVKAICVAMLAAVAAVAGEIRITSLDVESDRAVSVTGAQSNRIEAVVAHTNNTGNPHAVTLAQAAAAGGFAGTEAITPFSVLSQRFGARAGEDASGNDFGAYGFRAGIDADGDYWGAYGYGGGSGASGNYWGAYGASAGVGANGDYWGAYGASAGVGANGDYWGAYGNAVGAGGIGNNWTAFGCFAGWQCRGNNRIYIDVYVTSPDYPPDGATNDVIFGDSGYLHLGRGAGAPGGAQGGTLRGPWKTDAGLTVAGALTASTVNATTSAGGALQNANGQACLTWGAGNGQGVTFANGVNVSGALTVSGAATLTNTAVTGSFTLNGEPVGQCPVWQSCGLLPTAGGTQYPTLSQMAISLANTATNLWLVMQHPAPQSHVVLQLQTYGTSAAAGTNPVSVAIKTGGYGDLAVGSPTSRTVICDGSEASGRYTNIVYVAPSAAPTCGGAFLRFDLTRPNTMASGSGVTFVIPFWRCATSNEIETKTFAQ